MVDYPDTGIAQRNTRFSELDLLDSFVLGVRLASLFFAMLGPDAISRLNRIVAAWKSGTNPDLSRLRSIIDGHLPPHMKLDTTYRDIIQLLVKLAADDQTTRPNRLFG